MSVVSFFIVTVLGVVIDIALGYALVHFLGFYLWLAAIISFFSAALFNYILHEFWTFATNRDFSVRRAVKYIGASTFVLAIRLLAITFLAKIYPDSPLLVLIFATGVSFSINFILSKYLIFIQKEGVPMPKSDEKPWEIPEFDVKIYSAKQHRYALVIPVINEGTRIQGQLLRIKKASLPIDVIVADGGSVDGSLAPDFIAQTSTFAILTKLGAGKLSAQLRMAYAWVLQNGYEGVITIDGNGKDGVEAVHEMIAKLDAGYDYVQGSRYLPGGIAENTPFDRHLANRLIHAPILSLSGRYWFGDTTNGFRAYSARYLSDPRVQPFRNIFMRYELLFYLTVRAGQIGMRITQVAVERKYPLDTAVPTKISGFRGRVDMLLQTISAALGRYNP